MNTDGLPLDIKRARRKILLHHRSQHKSEQHRRRWESELGQDEAEKAEHGRKIDVERGIVDAVNADGGERHDGGEQQPVGHLQQPHPDADQREVQHDQHQVTDPHAGDQPPEQIGLFGHHLWARRDAVHGERPEHECHHAARRQPEREHGDELALCIGIVGGFRPRDALDRALAEAGRVLRQLLLDHVGRERRNRWSGAGQHAEERSDPRAAQDGKERGLEVFPRRQQARHLRGEFAPLFRAAEIADDLGNGEHADGDHDEADAVGQFGEAEAETLHARIDVGADEAEHQTQHHHRQRFHNVALRQHCRGDQPHQHQRKIFRRAKFEREARERRPEQRNQKRADGAGKERADGGNRQRRPGAALPRHLVAVDTGDDGRGLAR